MAQTEGRFPVSRRGPARGTPWLFFRPRPQILMLPHSLLLQYGMVAFIAPLADIILNVSALGYSSESEIIMR